MTAVLGELTAEQFLDEYWQKRPCRIRQAFHGYELPLDADDIAGLACEETAESRIVSGSFPRHDWELRHGPFDEEIFTQLGENRWTLLVQDVEKHYPPLQDLMDRFSFIPGWRLDDLMVSYAVPQGSVGPHVDQYDVFLYQASGEKLWQIATEFEPRLLDDCPLNVLEAFEAEKEWLLKPGDLLYLPPGVAHHGVAITEGMTWSVGLRAPSSADLLMALGESLASQPDGGPRYEDPDLAACSKAGEIDQAALSRLQALLQQSVSVGDSFNQFAGRFITRYRLAHEPVSPGPPIDSRELLSTLQQGSHLLRNPWTRLAWTEADQGVTLFAAGEAFPCSEKTAMELCANPQPDLFSSGLGDQDLEIILALVNAGHLVLSDPD